LLYPCRTERAPTCCPFLEFFWGWRPMKKKEKN
jgi:hypothetical protein